MVTSELGRIKELIGGKEPVVWVFTGDSITHGALHTYGWRSYPEHFAERIRWELSRYRDIIINSGISGDTVPGLTADLEHRVLRFRPQVVSIMMGTNDAVSGAAGRERFQAGYMSLVERIRRDAGALILLHTPNPVSAFERIREDLIAYVGIVRTVAAETGAVLIDQHLLWSQRTGSLESLLDDGTVHPNAFGHVLLAHGLFKSLEVFDQNSPTCRLFVP